MLRIYLVPCVGFETSTAQSFDVEIDIRILFCCHFKFRFYKENVCSKICNAGFDCSVWFKILEQPISALKAIIA